MTEHLSPAAAQYLTDSMHLYENFGVRENFGLAGGCWIIAENCVTGDRRELSPLETALCEPVLYEPDDPRSEAPARKDWPR